MKSRLSLKTKLAYGLGNVAVMVAKQAPKRLCFPIYNIALGVNAAWIGGLFSIMRLWDAVTDPLIGHLSDNYTSKYGRRKPFIVLGSILTGIFFAMLWILPRDLSPVGYMIYLTIILLLFYTALTIFSVPWYAMGYELTDEYDERTKLFAFPSFFSPISQIGVGWLYYLTQRSFFEDTIEGVRYVGIAVGVLMIGFGLLPAIFVKENTDVGFKMDSAPVKQSERKRTSLITNLRQSLSCKPFLIISITISIVLMASAIVGSIQYYINIYYLFGGDTNAASVAIGWYWTTVYGVAALAVPFVSKLAVRFGKTAVFQGALFWGVLVMAVRWFLFTPEMPYLQLVDAVLYAFLDATIFMLCQAMIADVCDYDEAKHGVRREGVFAAVFGWMFKTGLALGALVSGIILAAIGFDKKIVDVPAPETIESMRIIFSVVPGTIFLLGGLLFFVYPLNKKRMQEISVRLGREVKGEIPAD